MEAPITIVSGLPRSGTSMLMQMLYAGGMPVLTDDLRAADAHNPKGYFEYEAAKRLKQDQSWLPLAQGKAVKIVSHFLEFLPREHRYNVIFMRRDLGEVLASQNAMLGMAPGAQDAEMKRLFEINLLHLEKRLAAEQCFRTLYLDYSFVIGQSRQAAADIATFLGQNLDLEAMAQSVDPSLHRNRLNS